MIVFRKYRGLVVFIAAIAVLIALIAIITRKEGAKSRNSATVSANGGTYKLGDITVTVPKGAVARDTILSVSKPQAVSGSSAPLGASKAVQFDLSFAGGVEPAADKPLAVTIPLRDAMLPSGANAANALFYTRTSDGKNRILVPSAINAKGELKVSLAHLSEKMIVFPDVANYLKLLASNAINDLFRSCSKEVQIRSSGYKLKTVSSDESRMEACVTISSNGMQVLHINNKTGYTYSVVSADVPTQNKVEESIDDELVKAIAATYFAEEYVRGYITRGSNISGELNQSKSNSLVILRPSSKTWFAETLLKVLRWAVGTLLGDGKNSDILVKTIINGPADLQNCIAAATKAANGDNPLDYWFSLADALFGGCGGQIGSVVLAAVGESAAGGKALGKFLNVIDRLSIVKDAFDQTMSLIGTTIDTVKGDVRVEVKREYACATDEVFKKLVRTQNIKPTVVEDIQCESGWAYAFVRTEDRSGWLHIIRLVNSEWRYVDYILESYYDSPEHRVICKQMPSNMRNNLCVGVKF